MSKKVKKIHSLNSLDREIFRLRLENRQIVNNLDKNMDHFQHHYASMTLNSLLHRSSGKETIKEKILNSLMENENISNGVDKIVTFLVEKISEGIEYISEKIQHRKD